MIGRLSRSTRSMNTILENKVEKAARKPIVSDKKRMAEARARAYSFVPADSWTIARREGARGIIETEITVETTRLGCLTVIGKRE